MHTRPGGELSNFTLAELANEVRDDYETARVDLGDTRVSLVHDRLVRFGDHEVPFTEEGMVAIGAKLDVPYKFVLRQEPDLQEIILNEMFRRNHGSVCVLWNDEGIHGIHDPQIKVFRPRHIVDTALRVLPEESVVVEQYRSLRDFQFDVIVPADFDQGIGGDRHVGDITRGGLRMGLDTSRSDLVPWVEEFMVRLICTNGMEVMDVTNRVDGRNQSVDEVLWDLELAARRAFERVESRIADFYKLREERVSNPERTFLRLAEDHGIPTIQARAILERMPAIDGDEGATMFDLVNLITNEALAEGLQGRRSTRRKLEQAGGAIAVSHAERCGRCQSRLG